MTRTPTLVCVAAVLSLAAISCGGNRSAPRPTPTGRANAAASPTVPAPGAIGAIGSPSEQLLYVGPDQSLWIYETEHGAESQIVAAGLCPTFYTPRWNHDGSKFAVTCGPGVSTDAFIFTADGTQLDHLVGYGTQDWSPYADMILLDRVPEDPQTVPPDTSYALYDLGAPPAERIRDLPNVSSGVLFTPDGSSIVFYRAPNASCAPNCALGLVRFDLTDGAETTLGDLYPMFWLGDGHTLVVNADHEPGSNSFTSGAYLFDVATGVRTAIPALDGRAGSWLTDDPSKLVVLTFETDIGLSIVDLTTQRMTPIVASSIHYPSEGIPGGQVAPHGDKIYWFDATGAPSAWYVANMDGTGLAKLGEVAGFFVTFSPSRSFVAYPGAPTAVDPATGASRSDLIVSTIDGSRSVTIGPAAYGLAWRPAPSPSQP